VKDREAIVLEHMHPVDGVFRLSTDGVLVRAHCRWPFDRESGEWITLANEFSVDAVATGFAALASEQVSRVPGTEAGFLEFTELSEPGLMRVELAEPREDAPTRLSLNVPLTADGLEQALHSALLQVGSATNESQATP
jgi:hypothetical protein